jgi:MFS superfamily sulfate permease-like transporter
MLVGAAEPTPRAVILDGGANGDRLDITGAETMIDLVNELHAAGIDLAVAEVRLPVLTTARRAGLLSALGENRVFHTIPEALEALQASRPFQPGSRPDHG